MLTMLEGAYNGTKINNERGIGGANHPNATYPSAFSGIMIPAASWASRINFLVRTRPPAVSLSEKLSIGTKSHGEAATHPPPASASDVFTPANQHPYGRQSRSRLIVPYKKR